MPTSIVLAALMMASAMAAPPSPGELSEITCLYAKDPASCEISYRRSEKSSDGAIFARVGCEEAKSARACANYGDALAHERAPDQTIAAAYERGCTEESGLGCLRLLERMAAGGAVDVARAELFVQRVCDLRGGIEGQCPAAKTTQDLLRRKGDTSLAACQTEVQIFGSAGVTGKIQILPDASLRSLPKSKDECARECAKTVDSQYSSDSSDLTIRGRCKWGTTYLPTRLKSLSPSSRCSNDSQAMGTSTDRLFARCRCENPLFEAANKIADSFGAFVRAEVAYAKKFGKDTWYRCGASVRFDAESTLSAPTCAAKVADLRKALGAEPSLKGVVLNVQDLTCKGVKK